MRARARSGGERRPVRRAWRGRGSPRRSIALLVQPSSAASCRWDLPVSMPGSAERSLALSAESTASTPASRSRNEHDRRPGQRRNRGRRATRTAGPESSRVGESVGDRGGGASRAGSRGTGLVEELVFARATLSSALVALRRRRAAKGRNGPRLGCQAGSRHEPNPGLLGDVAAITATRQPQPADDAADQRLVAAQQLSCARRSSRCAANSSAHSWSEAARPRASEVVMRAKDEREQVGFPESSRRRARAVHTRRPAPARAERGPARSESRRRSATGWPRPRRGLAAACSGFRSRRSGSWPADRGATAAGNGVALACGTRARRRSRVRGAVWASAGAGGMGAGGDRRASRRSGRTMRPVDELGERLDHRAFTTRGVTIAGCVAAHRDVRSGALRERRSAPGRV